MMEMHIRYQPNSTRYTDVYYMRPCLPYVYKVHALLLCLYMHNNIFLYIYISVLRFVCAHKCISALVQGRGVWYRTCMDMHICNVTC